MLHIILHFIAPALVVWRFFSHDWRRAYLWMMATMAVDLDHLLANPIYDPTRCSIGFHPLHQLLPIVLYLLLCFPHKTRYVGLGLLIHMLLDSIDCQVTNGVWYHLVS